MPRSLLSRFSHSQIVPTVAAPVAVPPKGLDEMISAREMTRRLIRSARPLLMELEARSPTLPAL